MYANIILSTDTLLSIDLRTDLRSPTAGLLYASTVGKKLSRGSPPIS